VSNPKSQIILDLGSIYKQNPNNQVIRKEAQQVPRRRGRSQQNINNQENITKKRTKK
jgi:hypothetical protein